jgi:hypothetical protein
MIPDDKQVETFIRDALEQNFELLRLESGHALTTDVKDTALNQALLYWRKLKDVATTITETEVHLNLPGQKTPQGRVFGIEGIVDIVREDDRTIMYDIKTHDAEDVHRNIEAYERQLNVYAHIWQNLRGEPLDQTAVIATAYPEAVKAALASRDEARIQYELQRWNPLVEIEFSPEPVQELIADFGQVVDCIENGEFTPAPVEVLQGRKEDGERACASRVCRRCNARFSCSSYRAYASSAGGRPELALRQYLEDFGSDLEQQDWLSSNLEIALPTEELE